MGWWPTSPEYADFPREPKSGRGLEIRVQRAHSTAKGTAKNCIANVGSPGGHGSRRQTMCSKLARQAMARGWLNGKPLKRKGAI